MLRFEFARTPWARAWGLLGRTSFPESTAMVFEGCHAVHTWLMRMPIDVVFLDAAWRITSIHPFVKPWSGAKDAAAYTVLELAAGEAARLGLRTGDALTPS